mmetsp:Transcript_18150/g.50854  ORF Transcript_18150/g.50854 Transcript_18150/m.50854 type:complete len:128 (+) Transcript_18150:150-533(+)
MRPSLFSCFKPKCRGEDDGLTCDGSLLHQATPEPNHFALASTCNPPLECPSARMEALPFTWTTVTSDARIVLHHHFGLEPAAAQICSQALQLMSSSSSSSSQPCNSTIRGCSTSFSFRTYCTSNVLH